MISRDMLIWNGLRYINDPVTGRRQARLNPEIEWVRKGGPALRIIEESLWQVAKARPVPTPSDARDHLDTLIVLRHKLVLMDIREPFCLRRVSGRNGGGGSWPNWYDAPSRGMKLF